jgi:hypothetical protein
MAPFPALAGMAISSPASELVVEFGVDELEVTFGDTMLADRSSPTVVGPALDDGVEHITLPTLLPPVVLSFSGKVFKPDLRHEGC